MGNKEVRIGYLGTPSFGAIILKALIGNGYRPVLVISASLDCEVAQLALQNKIKTTDNLNDLDDIDLIISASYGKIIPKKILDSAKHSAINIHPSLLPKYRGPSPIQAAILAGDKTTGTTIMLMDGEIDHGDIIAQKEFAITKDYPYLELDNQLAKLSAELLVQILPDWLENKIKTKPQNHDKATHTKIIKKSDGEIDCARGLEYIERQIRAYAGWPSAYTYHNGKMIKILEARLRNNELEILKVQPESKRPMSYADFLLGHRDFKLC